MRETVEVAIRGCISICAFLGILIYTLFGYACQVPKQNRIRTSFPDCSTRLTEILKHIRVNPKVQNLLPLTIKKRGGSLLRLISRLITRNSSTFTTGCNGASGKGDPSRRLSEPVDSATFLPFRSEEEIATKADKKSVR